MTHLPLSDLTKANTAFAAVFSGAEGAEALLQAAAAVLPITAGFAVVNLRNAPPVYLADSYATPKAKSAVQRYVSGTYLLNPVSNAIRQGLTAGVYRMADLAPDHWGVSDGEIGVTTELSEEIGYLTPGWPRGQAEISVLTQLPDGAMAEMSLARPSAEGGFSDAMVDILTSLKPLIDAAQSVIWTAQSPRPHHSNLQSLEDFGRDRLSPREAEILQMVLKGHSNRSISLTLGITVPTVKTHRKNAYVKLGIATQQELFYCFLKWTERA